MKPPKSSCPWQSGMPHKQSLIVRFLMNIVLSVVERGNGTAASNRLAFGTRREV